VHFSDGSLNCKGGFWNILTLNIFLWIFKVLNFPRFKEMVY